jgi:hypothetical protein
MNGVSSKEEDGKMTLFEEQWADGTPGAATAE